MYAQSVGAQSSDRPVRSILAGQGAKEFAISEALTTFSSSGPLISPQSLQRHASYKEMLDRDVLSGEPPLKDTVGAIVSDLDGSVAVALSSGGVHCKRPGRVGDTAIPGAGFWILKRDSQTAACCTTGMACWCKQTTSLVGTGEQLIYTDFARSICNTVLDSQSVDLALSEFLHDFSQHRFQTVPSAGFICLINDDCGDRRITEVWYGFTTESMCVACLWGGNSNPECRVERLVPSSTSYRIKGQAFFHSKHEGR